jgi:4-amino-4-deoxy-L-arabinose transferase-like glycosyltransferase
VVAVVTLAAVLRCIAAVRTEVMFNDGPLFIALAQRFSTGEWSAALVHDYHPLYSLAIALVHVVVGNWEQAGILVSVSAGTAAVFFLHVFLADAFDERVAWVGALLLAVHPYALSYSSDVQSDGLYLALLLAAVAVLWRSVRSASAGRALAAGALSALAYLTRPEGVGVVLVGLGMGSFLVIRRRWRLGRALSWAAALVAGALLLMSPYLVVMRVQNGTWMLTQKKSVTRMIQVDERSQPERHAAYVRRKVPSAAAPGERSASMVTPPAAPPAETSKRRAILWEIWRAAAPGLRYENLLFVLVGLYAWRRRLGESDVLIAGFVALYAIVLGSLAFGSGYVSRRHMVPPLVLLLGYAGIGVPLVGRALVGVMARVLRKAPPPGGIAALATGVVLVLALTLPKDLSADRVHRRAVHQAAEWLHDQPELTGPVATSRRRIAYYAGERPVATSRRRIAYYAGEPYVQLVAAPPPELVSYLRRSRVRFVVADEATLVELTGSTGDEIEAFRVLHTVEAEGRRASVFELKPR